MKDELLGEEEFEGLVAGFVEGVKAGDGGDEGFAFADGVRENVAVAQRGGALPLVHDAVAEAVQFSGAVVAAFVVGAGPRDVGGEMSAVSVVGLFIEHFDGVVGELAFGDEAEFFKAGRVLRMAVDGHVAAVAHRSVRVEGGERVKDEG